MIKWLDSRKVYITLIMIFIISDYIIFKFFPESLIFRPNVLDVGPPVLEELIFRVIFIGLVFYLLQQPTIWVFQNPRFLYGARILSVIKSPFFLIIWFGIFIEVILVILSILLRLGFKDQILDVNVALILFLIALVLTIIAYKFSINRIRFLLFLIALSSSFFAFNHELTRIVGTFTFSLFTSLMFINRSQVLEQAQSNVWKLNRWIFGYLSVMLPHLLHNNLEFFIQFTPESEALTLISMYVISIFTFMKLDSKLFAN